MTKTDVKCDVDKWNKIHNDYQKLEFHSWDEFHDHIKQEIDALNSKHQILSENFS